MGYGGSNPSPRTSKNRTIGPVFDCAEQGACALIEQFRVLIIKKGRSGEGAACEESISQLFLGSDRIAPCRPNDEFTLSTIFMSLRINSTEIIGLTF